MHAATLPKSTTPSREVNTGTVRENRDSFSDTLSDNETLQDNPPIRPSHSDTSSQNFPMFMPPPPLDAIYFNNRPNMYASQLPQQVAINIYNSSPRNMPYLETSSHFGVPPPPLSFPGGTSLLEESQIPRVPPPPPSDFEDSLPPLPTDLTSLHAELPPLPTDLPSLSTDLPSLPTDIPPPLPETPPPVSTGTKRFSLLASSSNLARIPENVTSPTGRTGIARPPVPPPPVPTKKIPPPVPVKTAKLRSFRSEETLLDTNESASVFSTKRTAARPVSLVATNLQQFGFASGNLGKTGTTVKPPQSPTNNPVKQSVSDRKKFFETAMEKSQKPSKQEKVFSYLSADELEKLKAEEDRKIATLSQSELLSLQELEHSDGESVDPISSRPSSTIGIVRTAKAEKRLRDRMREEGLLTDEEDSTYGGLSPAEERTLRAEKRAAWRAARLKSLEQDAIQAQMVIKSMTDMVGSGAVSIPEGGVVEEQVVTNLSNACDTEARMRPSSADFPKLEVRTTPGHTKTVRENEKVLDERVTRRTEEYVDEMGVARVRTVEYVEKTIEKEVEQIQEKIISLELIKPEDLNEKPVDKLEDDEEGDESFSEPPTPTKEQEQSDFTDATTNKRRRRKKSKKGKN